MRNLVRHIFAIGALSVLTFTPVFAESTPRLQASKEAGLFQPWNESRRVGYDQILADPDNVELNFRYAQTLLHDGRPKDAVPTLQRILATHPELAQVRLLYTMVLLRLDNLAEAERELTQVQKASIDAAAQKDIDRLAKEIAHRRKTTRWDIALSMGLQYDQNRNATPASGEAELDSIPIPIQLGAPFEKENDLAYVTTLDARVQHDLQRPGQPKLIGGLRIHNAEQVELDYFDLVAIELSGGTQFNVGGGAIKSELLFDQVMFSSETYLKSVGARIEYQRALADRIRLSGRFQAEYQDYDRIKMNPLAERRTGWRYEYAVRGDYIWSAQHYSGLELYVIDQGAHKDDYAFEAPGIAISHLWIPARDHFLVSKLSYEYHRYDGPNMVVANDRRKENRYRARFTYGTTLAEILPFASLPSGIDDIVASVSADFFRSDANILNYEYRNNTYALMLTKRWKL